MSLPSLFINQSVEMSDVSIIIPTFNEAATLGRTLRHLSVLYPSPKEILVVDGGSSDRTVEIAQEQGIAVIYSQQAGRAVQMNQGAKAAIGSMLCFLHADTFIPDDLLGVIEKTLAERAIALGGFISIMEGEQKTRWGTTLHNYLKTYYAPLLFRPYQFLKGLRLLFGDQVMFCRADDFWRCGGFDPELPIMEEADLCVKLAKYGRIKLVNRIVRSSDRRVAKLGAFKAQIVYLYIGLLWGLGVSGAYLKQFYEDIR